MAVFDELKRAWRQAVSNFWEELEGADRDERARGAYTEVARVRRQRDELEAAIGDTRQRLDHENGQVEACVRRERLAREIDDGETARIAGEYAARHRERAEVLSRKLEALEAERGLCVRDLGEMERAIQDRGLTAERPELDDLNRHPLEGDFRDLEETARGRTAEERLEELKRRMDVR